MRWWARRRRNACPTRLAEGTGLRNQQTTNTYPVLRPPPSSLRNTPRASPQFGHAARQMALCAVYLGQRCGQRSRVKAPLRPVGPLPEVGAGALGFFGEHAAIVRFIHRILCGE